MPKLILSAPVFETATEYAPPEHDPGPFASVPAGEIGGLTHFGARFETLPPGSASSMRHWHSHEDEFALILDGTLVLCEDTGETVLGPGAAAGFAAGRPNGHHLRNRSDAPATFLILGNRWAEDVCTYSGQDRVSSYKDGVNRVTHRDGTPLARRDASVPAIDDPVPDAPSAVIDIDAVPLISRSSYPDPYAALMHKRSWRRLGAAAGLTRLAVNLVTLAPGGISALRHWHTGPDEFVLMRTGALTLVEDEGAVLMQPGDCAAFPAGRANGHHLRNDGAATATFLVAADIVDRDTCTYSDVDLIAQQDGARAWYTNRDGTLVKEV